MILLDTNVLIRMTRSSDPKSGLMRTNLHRLLVRKEQLVIVPQNLYEFWTVVTRGVGAAPLGQNGLSMTTAQAGQWLKFFRRRFTLLPDRAELSELWQTLVEAHAVKGFQSHYVRLVAAMQSYGITRLLTLNPVHFRRLPITVLDPETV